MCVFKLAPLSPKQPCLPSTLCGRSSCSLGGYWQKLMAPTPPLMFEVLQVEPMKGWGSLSHQAGMKNKTKLGGLEITLPFPGIPAAVLPSSDIHAFRNF